MSELNLTPNEKLFRYTLLSNLVVTADDIPASFAISEDPVNKTSPYFISCCFSLAEISTFSSLLKSTSKFENAPYFVL